MTIIRIPYKRDDHPHYKELMAPRLFVQIFSGFSFGSTWNRSLWLGWEISIHLTFFSSLKTRRVKSFQIKTRHKTNKNKQHLFKSTKLNNFNFLNPKKTTTKRLKTLRLRYSSQQIRSSTTWHWAEPAGISPGTPKNVGPLEPHKLPVRGILDWEWYGSSMGMGVPP